jgi:hypothetical protein
VKTFGLRARAVRKGTRRAVLLNAVVVWGALLASVTLACGLVFVLMDSVGVSTPLLRKYAGVSMGAAMMVFGCLFIWWSRRRRIVEMTRRTLLDAFPRQRKDLDPWLAGELHGGDCRAVRRVLTKRLSKALPDVRPVVPAERVPHVRLGLVVWLSALLMTASLAGLSPTGIYARYVDGIQGRRSYHALNAASVGPELRWYKRGDSPRIRACFDRPPAEIPAVRLLTEPRGGEGGTDPIPMTLVGVGPVHEATLPPLHCGASMVFTAEGLESPPLKLSVFPEDVLMLLGVALLSRGATDPRHCRPGVFPLTVEEGTRVRFSVGLRKCPVKAFGLRGSNSGETPLVRIEGDRFLGTVAVQRDDVYRLWWELPDGSTVKTGFFSVKCRRPDEPTIRITSPREGIRFLPSKPIRVEVECTYARPVRSGRLMGSDYHGMAFSRTIPMAPAGNGRHKGMLELSIDELPRGRGRVLGLCAAVARGAGRQGFVASDIVNIVLPRMVKISPRTLREPSLLRQLSVPDECQLGSVYDWPKNLNDRRLQRLAELIRMAELPKWGEGCRNSSPYALFPDGSVMLVLPQGASGQSGASSGRPGSRTGWGQVASRSPSGGGFAGRPGSGSGRTAGGGMSRGGASGRRSGDGARAGGGGGGKRGGKSGRGGSARRGGRPGDGGKAGNGTGGGVGGGGGAGAAIRGGGGGADLGGEPPDLPDPVAAPDVVRGRKSTPGRVSASFDRSRVAGAGMDEWSDGAPALDEAGPLDDGGSLSVLTDGGRGGRRMLPFRELAPSEREQEIARFDRAVNELDVGDRRVVQEYYRMVRDARE